MLPLFFFLVGQVFGMTEVLISSPLEKQSFRQTVRLRRRWYGYTHQRTHVCCQNYLPLRVDQANVQNSGVCGVGFTLYLKCVCELGQDSQSVFLFTARK